MSTKEIIWNEVSSLTVPELVISKAWRPLLGRNRNVHTFVPGRPGSWVTPGKPGLRHLRVEGYVQAASFERRREAIEEVSDWLDVEGEAHLQISDMPDRYYLATVSDSNDPDEWRETGVLEIVWDVQPYSFDDTISTESWTSDIDDNHVWNPGLLGPVYPVIAITPTNGSLTGFTLEGNGDTLTFSGNILTGQAVTVNSIVPIVVNGANYDADLTGAFDPAQVIMTGVAGTFPVLMPGSNNLHFVKTGGTATSFSIQVQYRKTYRS